MRAQKWNEFRLENPKAILLISVVSASLPANLKIDRNGLILPTPYQLLRQWMSKHMGNPWAARVQKSSGKATIMVHISAISDAAKLAKFGQISQIRLDPIHGAFRTFGYRDEIYGNVARSLGFEF